jgi:hypothetical protein
MAKIKIKIQNKTYHEQSCRKLMALEMQGLT